MNSDSARTSACGSSERTSRVSWTISGSSWRSASSVSCHRLWPSELSSSYAVRPEQAIARPVQKIGEVQIGHLLERVAILWLDIKYLAAGDELRLVIPHVPAVARRDDHDLAELVIVDREAVLRHARLDHDGLGPPPEPIAHGEPHGGTISRAAGDCHPGFPRAPDADAKLY
jgi:hypothetical protein